MRRMTVIWTLTKFQMFFLADVTLKIKEYECPSK